MGEGHATGHGCVLLQSRTLPGAVGKECFRLLYDNSCGVQWASAHTSCLPTEARSELPANSVFLRNVENVTILQSGSSHQIIILLLNSLNAETYRALLNLYKGNEEQNTAAGGKRNCQNHHEYLRCLRKCHGYIGNNKSPGQPRPCLTGGRSGQMDITPHWRLSVK